MLFFFRRRILLFLRDYKNSNRTRLQLFFLQKRYNEENILIAVFVNSLLTSVFFYTLWVYQVTGNTFIMQLYARVPSILFNFVMNSVVLVLVFPKLVRILRTEILNMNAHL